MLALQCDRRVFSGFGAFELSLLSLLLGVISKSDASGSLCHIAEASAPLRVSNFLATVCRPEGFLMKTPLTLIRVTGTGHVAHGLKQDEQNVWQVANVTRVAKVLQKHSGET